MPLNYVYASNNYDSIINDVLTSIDENSFSDITNFLNEIFGSNLTLKEMIIKFFNGEITFNFDTLINFLTSGATKFISNFGPLLCYVIFLGILSNISNSIIGKNNDNIENNTVFYICYIVCVAIITKLLYEVVNYSINVIENVSNLVELVFPIMFSLSGLVGSFGVSLFKPFTAVLSLFTSTIVNNFFMPLIMIISATVIASNLSKNLSLNTLTKNLFSLFKWSIGIFTLIFSALVTAQGFVNMQFNGASVKVLKYATGSLVPIVGGFLSGGVDVLLSSVILIKNSVGLITIVYLILYVGSKAVSILLFSFIVKFATSLCEPIIDSKFLNCITKITDVFNLLASLIFICGYIFIIVVLSFISVTGAVI
ncbi:MAG: stage III sporulation protein AE [Clostridia bacterium]|nr:stage III sporulation protein AE [Clostridia bacterium]